MKNQFSLTGWQKGCLLFFSFLFVAFGQPAWNEWLGLVAAAGGFACFWRVLLEIPRAKERFCVAMGWYTAVQIVQLSWFVSHPYWYIYGVFFFCAWLMGAQWGLLALWIKPKIFDHPSKLFAIAAGWVLLEWSRLFILSGLPFNPVGLSLSSSIYPLQLASIGGVYGLSFYVILTNLFVLRAWIRSYWNPWVIAGVFILFPYLFGWGHLYFHDGYQSASSKNLKTLGVVLVQSALPIEEKMVFQSAEEVREFVLNEWRHVLSTLKKQLGKQVELIVLPENLVPYGTYHHIFRINDVHQLFKQLFGDKVTEAFPSIESSYRDFVWTGEQMEWFVSNAYLVQTLANFFQSHVVIGLEDSIYADQYPEKAESYSAALHFVPHDYQKPSRYEKRVLVPMGEYIPFTWCQELAARYGVRGSFMCGKEAKVFAGPVLLGPSVCYEEIYGNLMRENRQKGAELFVNLTNDGWYPHSRLPKQHFDHARLRTVENGVPLVRACNTGVTGAIDSLGRVITLLGENSMESQELADSLFFDLSLYHYSTFYTRWGDFSIIGFACLCLFINLINFRTLLKRSFTLYCHKWKIENKSSILSILISCFFQL